MHAPDSKKTVGEIFEEWIAHSERLERSTVEQRKRHLKLHIAPIARMKLADLTTPRVNVFLDQLRDSGRSAVMRRKILTRTYLKIEGGSRSAIKGG